MAGIALSQAKKALLGLGELKAWAEIDRLMETILVFHSHDRAIRMTYLKALNEQSRYIEATADRASMSMIATGWEPRRRTS